jgi:PAS domain S-box-containing protein
MRSVQELQLIAAIADDLAAGVWVATAPDGRFVYANRAFEEIMGMGPVADVAVGEYAQPYGIYDLDGALYPEDKMPFVRALQARATVIVDDIVIHRSDGTRVHVRAHAKPMFDEAGEITHVAIAFFDVSAERTARREAAEARHRLSQVIASAPVVLFVLDPSGVITLCDGRGLDRTGLKPTDFVGRSVFELYADVPAIVDGARRALAGVAVQYVAEITQGNAVYEVWLAPLRGEGGTVLGAIGVGTDVTDRHRMQVQLAQSERLASVGMLAAGVAHEINNPLSYVIGGLDLVARDLVAARAAAAVSDGALFDALEERVRDARRGAERVRGIVRDLKVFSRVDERRPSALDVRASIQAALSLAANEIRHRARLALDLSPVPPVSAEEGRLGQLFLNLIVNAAQAIAEGAAEKNEIRVTTRHQADDLVRVEVSDTGAGIPSELLGRIFDPFFTTKPVGVGTGLGLAICHAIVADLGGRIEVESAPGEGTTFRVLLPPASRAVDASSLAPPAGRPAAKRGAILVVDDEPLILKTIAPLLAPEHDVVCESRADVALERIRAGQRFDAILCDLMMPEMTGIDLHSALLEIAPAQAQAMLFLTGGAFTARGRAFLERVSNPTLEKPFDAAVLLQRVRQLVG